MPTGGAITLEMIKQFSEELDQKTWNTPRVLLTSKAVYDVAGDAGQREAQADLSRQAAATRPVFGDILTGIIGPPDHKKAAEWFLGGGPWPYTAPDPEPVTDGLTFVDLERSEVAFWRSSL